MKNETAIAQNATNISNNAKNIETNTKNIASNTEKIGTIEKQVNTNTEKIGTIETQVSKNTEKIGTIESQVKTNTETIKTATENIGKIETKVDSNTEKIGTIESQVKSNTENISKYSEKISNIEQQMGSQQEALENSKVDGGSYTINANQRTVTVKNKDNSDAFTLTVEASAGGVYTSGDHINIDNDYKISVNTDGKVESGNTGIVTGGAVYEKVGDTSKLKEAGLSDNLADSVLTVNEKVDNVANQVVDVVNNSMGTLRNDINKVGAGAAALAALRPEGFDPDDKWSFAVGYGHYKNANAGAFGAFYKPNQDTTVSIGSTIGNGDSMMNAGVSFKFGSRGKGAGIYRTNTDLVRAMNTLSRDNEKLKSENAVQARKLDAQAKEIGALKADNAQMKADNARMQAQIAQIFQKLELSDTVKKTAAAH